MSNVVVKKEKENKFAIYIPILDFSQIFETL